MAKIYGIKITKSTIVSGNPVSEGDELIVPDDISEDDARVLLRMGNRAEEIDKPETAPADKGDPDDSNELLKLLDQTVAKIEAELQSRVDEEFIYSADDLAVLRQAEEDGKTRVGVIDAIDAEIASRSE